MNWYKRIAITIPKKNMHGDCFETAGRYVMDHTFLNKEENKNIFLVHGEVTGQGAIKGVKYGHAWVEENGMVIDNSNKRNIKIPKELYYAIGNITNTIKYTPEEARKKMLQFKHWRPWDLVTEY